MSANPASILDMVKKSIGFEPEYTAFDLDISMLINSSLGTLAQLGVGPADGLFVQDNSVLWSALTSQKLMLGLVQSFLFQTVRLVFDPPGRFGLSATQKQIDELTWRIVAVAETLTPPSDPFLIEGQSLENQTQEQEDLNFIVYTNMY